MGAEAGARLRDEQAILGVFDEGCMGMYNAIIPDHLMHAMGLFKERLSESALYAAMQRVPEAVARRHYEWLLAGGMRFALGTDEATALTERQVLEGLQMYDAAVRLAHDFGSVRQSASSTSRGLRTPASRRTWPKGSSTTPIGRRCWTATEARSSPDARSRTSMKWMSAGVDGLLTDLTWRSLDIDPSNTLHDVRWGAPVRDSGVDEFVWVFQISGAAPASHFIGGYARATGERQPPMYFPKGTHA